MEESWWMILLAFIAGAALSGLLVAARLQQPLRAWKQQAEDEIHRQRREMETEMERQKARADIDLEKQQGAREAAWRQQEGALAAREDSVAARGQILKDEEDRLAAREAVLEAQEANLKERMHEAEKNARLFRMRLHSMTGWDAERAVEAVKEEARRSIEQEIQQMRAVALGRTEKEIEEHARRTLLAAMQRIANQPASEASATMVKLKSEEMKGRIIGREGRNIRCFETLTGTTLMIDESPESVLVSSFDPVRREVARMALENLMKDGRINPATIEETVLASEREIQRTIQEWGEKALRTLRLHSVPPEVVELLGKLHYRLSNNQNTLDHSIEVGFICSLLAAELGLDQTMAKRAGLFHDMGKAVSQEYEGSHARVAADILKRYGEDWRVVNAVAAHHEEVPDESAYAPLVKVADSLSAMRPGARTDSMESYLRRIKSLEEVARSLPGVEDAFAIQAGREVRVIVAPEVLDDDGARRLALTLRQRIEEEMNFPGTIKVTVIRERRFSETAK